MKYPFYTYNDEIEGHTFWVAKSLSLKGCVGQGDTIDDAVSELAVNENDWLEGAEEFGITIPKNERSGPSIAELFEGYSGDAAAREMEAL